MKADGVSGGQIRLDLIPGLFLMARWLRSKGNRSDGVTECCHARIATRSVAGGDYCAFGEVYSVGDSCRAFVCNIYY